MRCLFLFLVVIVLVVPAAAQEARLLPLSDPAYPILERLMRRGHLPSLDPTAQPYATGKVREALASLRSAEPSQLNSTEAAWVDYVVRRLGPERKETQPVRIGLHASAGARVANSDRLDAWRPLGDGAPWLPHNSLYLSLGRGAFVMQGGWQMDYFYEVDPDGYDAVNRLYARSEDSYVGARGDWYSLYLGRFDAHWGPFSEAAAFVSRNPRAMDQANASISIGPFTLRAILAELDNAGPDGELSERARRFEAGSRRRFLATHRLDFAPSPDFSFSLVEATLYSGTATGLGLKYLIPTHIHLLASGGYPRNQEYNLLLGALARARVGKTTWNAQVLLDDFVVENRGSLEESGRLEPTTFTLLGSVWLAPALRGALEADLGITAEAVAYQTYNTDQAEGRYLYLGRGIATQFVDYIRIAVRVPFYLDAYVPGFSLEPRLGYLAQGEQVLDQDFFDRYEDGPVAETILTGTPARSFHAGMDARLERVNYWLRLDLGLNPTRDAGFVAGASETRTYVLAEVGLRLNRWWESER